MPSSQIIHSVPSFMLNDFMTEDKQELILSAICYPFAFFMHGV